MSEHLIILGAGFGGLELAARLSETAPGEVRVTLIDRGEGFSFGFSKLDVLFGHLSIAEVVLPYDGLSIDGVEFRRERVIEIDPEARRVRTDEGEHEGDLLAIALGADYDLAATPGFAEGGFDYYSLAGAERLRGALAGFERGRILIAILGQPFKCPPAPFEAALLLDDQLAERGVRSEVEIKVAGPMAAPVPINEEVSGAIRRALEERGIEYLPNQLVVGLDSEDDDGGDGDGARRGEARLEGGGSLPYDLLIGIPVHRVPEAVERSGLTEDGWVRVDPATLATRHDGVYALGDVAAAIPVKAGVFAESAGRVVAEDIAARLHGGEPGPPWEGAGSCFIEFGAGMVGKVEANFLGGPRPAAELVGPSRELAAEKEAFGASRRRRWFGR